MSEMTMQLFLGTNSEEVRGFLNAYMFSYDCFIYVMCVLVILCVVIVVSQFCYKVKITKWMRIIVLFGVLICAILNICRDLRFVKLLAKDDPQSIIVYKNLYRYSKNYTTFGRIVYSCAINRILINDIERLVEKHSETVSVPCSFRSHNVVVIIGESFNKYHSSLYGYGLTTNPLLEQERENGNLYIYNDVSTPFNATYRCLKSLLSFESQDNNITWTSSYLFPAVFKMAGYNVSFISNQEVTGENGDSFDLYNNYLCNKDLKQYLFDYTNTNKCAYDGDLIQENLAPLRDSTSANKLVIYHLLGQHMEYASRYPREYNIFSVSDYPHRLDLNDNAKYMVANYDNATLYNDYVVQNILNCFRDEDAIVLYFADHGEGVYDFNNRLGRCHEEVVVPDRAKYEYSVPFMIWMSNEYKINHPDIVDAAAKSIDDAFMIDDLPHLLLDIAGIEFDDFDPSRSLLNSSYNKKRTRYIEIDKQNYESLIQ